MIEHRILIAVICVAMLGAMIGYLVGWQAHRSHCHRKYGGWKHYS